MAFSRAGRTMRWTRSFFRVALNDSARALSQHTPVRPTEGRILWCPGCRANCCEVYWPPRPRVEDRDALPVGAAAHGHIDGVADEVGSHVVGHGVADDLLGQRQSRTPAGYTNPTHVRMYVMPPTHLSPGARAAGVPAHEAGAGIDVARRGAVVRTLRRDCAAHRVLLAHDGGGPCPPRLSSRPCGAARRRARRHPQNHVRGAQPGFDHQGRLPPSDPRGGVGPARPARSIRTPGTPSRLAHGCDGAVAPLHGG